MEGRGDRPGRDITLPCLLDHCRYSRGRLVHFSTVPPYLLLKQPDESFMHRKLKNTVRGVVDEGGDKRKKRGMNERGEVIEEAKGDRDEVREADWRVTEALYCMCEQREVQGEKGDKVEMKGSTLLPWPGLHPQQTVGKPSCCALLVPHSQDQ